jgi:hypothetical protein
VKPVGENRAGQRHRRKTTFPVNFRQRRAIAKVEKNSVVREVVEGMDDRRTWRLGNL